MSGNKMLGDGLNCAEHSREKEIANLKQQLADSQAKVKELEAKIETHIEMEKIDADTINNWAKRYAELEEQVKGMRNCWNCLYLDVDTDACHHPEACNIGSYEYWQPKEG